jgi:hypothetical protein
MKNCKIVTTYFGNRRKFPHNFEESMDLFSKMIEKEKETDAGVDCDVIIVNHLLEQNSHKVIELLDSIDGTETKNGKIITMNRPHDNGEGLGFKSRNYAFQKYKEDYEYWFFVEDDCNFFKDFYYKKCIDILEKKPHVAFVCTVSDVIAKPCRDIGSHCHGSVGCTHVRFLKEIGEIPYAPNGDYRQAELIGEVKGTNIFVNKGYSLAILGEHVHTTEFWDSITLNWYKKEQKSFNENPPYKEYHPQKGFINE